MMKGIAFVQLGALLVALAIGNTAYAGSKTVNLTLRVLVDAPPPCTVDGAAVEFGNVVIKSIDGARYLKPIDYVMKCPSRFSDDLRMQVQGTTTTINGETVLSTGINGFGIRIQNVADHSLFTLGSSDWLLFNYGDGIPQLEAVPVKENGVQLTPSEFSSSATLVVDYQ